MISQNDVLPNQCSLCFNNYEDNRKPLILISCGHTYCEICLEKIFENNKKEIVCPECKLITNLPENNINKLPKNRIAMDLNFLTKKKLEINIKNEKEEKKLIKEKISFNESCKIYEDIIYDIEKKYNEIYDLHPYLKENKEAQVIDEID